MIRKNLIPITLICIIMGLFSFTSKRKDSGTDVVIKLEALGYYKYANPDKVAELKTDLINSYNKYKIVSTVINDKTLLPYDYRLYFCDGEALFEEGGLEDYLGYAKHAFEKRGLKFDWNNEISEEEDNHWNHRINVNGKAYVAFEGSMERMDIWGVAQLNFYRLLNDQLEIQGAEDRIYPISGGEDGQFIFLTPELYDYISKTFYQGKDFKKWDIPYPVEKWKDVSGLR